MLRKFTDLQKRSFEVNKPDFYKAMKERNYEEMADIYNEMMRYNDLAATDGLDRHFFAEVLEGYVLKIPANALSFIHRMKKDFYYVLTDSYIVYDVDDYPVEDGETDITFDYLKSENIEAEKIVFTGDTISFTPTAVKTLNLLVGDIIEIEIFDSESFQLSKFEKPFIFD